MKVQELNIWMGLATAMMMDDRVVGFSPDIGDGEIIITDMDDDCPETLLTIHDESVIIDNGGHVCVIDGNGEEFILKRLMSDTIVEVLDESLFLDKKEMIAGILFEDNKLGEHYERPSEEDCHILAEEILKRIDSTVTTEDFVQVIVLDREDELIEEMVRFPETNEGNEKAEKLFLDKCEHYFTNWDEYSDEDVEAILEQGYEQNNKYKVMLHHD